jgi:hypothetical protein
MRTAGAFGIALLIALALRAERFEDVLLTGRGASLSVSLSGALLIWLTYVAVEPYTRRLWPEMLVSWIRLLSGRARDPLVGRDILVGTIGGVVLAAAFHLCFLIQLFIGLPPPEPTPPGGDVTLTTLTLMSGRYAVSALPGIFADGLFRGFFFVGVRLVLMTMVLRRRRLAAVAWVIVMIPVAPLVPTEEWIIWVIFNAIVYSTGIFVVLRFGLLAFVTHLVPFLLLTHVSLRFAGLAPWVASSYLIAASVVALALYGFHTALGTGSIFGETAREERPGAAGVP